MFRDLILVIGIPGALMLLFTLLLKRGQPLPTWQQRLSERPSLIWNVGIGFIISLSFLRWLLQR